MKRGFGFAIVGALVALGACKKSVADFCEQSSDCTELGKPFCDVAGEYAESMFIGKTCIPFPDDDTKDFCLDDDRDCPTSAPICGDDRVCRGCTASAECGESAPYCDLDSGTCLACEPDAFQRCDGTDLVVCNADGSGEDVTSCSTTCDETLMRCDDCEPDDFLGCSDGTTASICSSAGVPEETACAYACNAGDMRCEQCEPGTTKCDPDLGPVGSTVACDLVGQVSDTQTCHVSCDDDGAGAATCLDLDPSNGLATYLDMTATAADVVLTGNQTIDTSTGAVSGGSITNFLVSLSTGDMVRVYVVKSLTQSGTLRVTGDHPIAIVSHGDVIIRGHINVSANQTTGAAGSRLDSTLDCAGEDGDGDVTMPQDGIGGGGGGGFGMEGAAGGAPMFEGGSGGAPGLGEPGGLGPTTFEPLRGGCAGGGGGPDASRYGGAGGGAIQISSRTAIVFGDGGFVFANGGGGGSGDPSDVAAGGGGSGGAILLEAPDIRPENLGVSAGILANGGGGACIAEGASAFAGGDPGLDGSGGAGAQVCGPDGGNGGSSSMAATEGLAGTSASRPSGGGGGGSVGAIGVRGTYQDDGSLNVSPAVYAMSLRTRTQQ